MGWSEQHKKLATTPPGGHSNIRSWWPPMMGGGHYSPRSLTTSLFGWTTPGVGPHGQIFLGEVCRILWSACPQDAEIRRYLAVLSSLPPTAPLAQLEILSLSTAGVAGIVPLAQLETASLSTARATCRKTRKRQVKKFAHNLPGTRYWCAGW